MISNEGRFVIVLTFLTHVNCQSDDSCSKPGIYINNFLPSAHLSLERVRGLAKVFLVSLGQKIKNWLFQQNYKVVPSPGHYERHRCAVRKLLLDCGYRDDGRIPKTLYLRVRVEKDTFFLL